MDEIEKTAHSSFLYEQCLLVFENENSECVMNAISRLVLDLIEEYEWDLEETQDYFRIIWKTALLIKKKEDQI